MLNLLHHLVDYDGCAALPAYRWDSLVTPVRIALIGKYTGLEDAYLSVTKALQHACMAANLKLEVRWVEAQYLEEAAKESDADKYLSSWEQVSPVVYNL